MSYPRKLHVLIIEDDPGPIDGYTDMLSNARDAFPSIEPTIVRSYADAQSMLQSPRIFHCLILDLNLPLANRQQPAEGLAPGEQLLELAAQRDDYPVPVLLVISGKLETASFTDLQAKLSQSFWYGVLIGKKNPKLEDELRTGLYKTHEYLDVGIHLRDSGNRWFPTLAPREEDLLRRCILEKPGRLGVDLEWWSAEHGPSLSHPTANDGPTKVLMGRFLLDDGMEFSRPTFFKFEPSGNASYVCRDVTILDHKLSHVKVQHSASSKSRSLLVTQSVTDSRPVSLDSMLMPTMTVDDTLLPLLVEDIVGQLGKLGDTSENEIPVPELLWKYHNVDNLKATYRPPSGLSSSVPSPIAVFEELVSSTVRVWATKRACIHGDLNATNVAVDIGGDGRPRAYIFDAAGIHADVDTRDLAVLEVTTLLFSNDGDLHAQFSAFEHFYSGKLNPGPLATLTSLPTSVRRTAILIAAIRQQVEKCKNHETYPIVLFDTALLQLGGLVVQPKRNKICQPQEASALAAWIATWLKRSKPSLFPASSPVQPK